MYKGYIYRHWIINDEGIEKSYVGQTKNELKKRWENGNGYTRKQDHKMSRAIKKYDWDNFKHEVVLTIECKTEDELIFWLDQWEMYYIEKYDSYYNGYNSTLGGGNGSRCDESKERMSKSQKALYDNGYINPMQGYTWSEKQLQQKSDSMKAYYETEQGKQQLERQSERLKGRFSGENNPMYGIHRYGEDSPHYGKPHSEETKQKLREKALERDMSGSSNPNSKKVICLDTKQIFDSGIDAQEWCGTSSKAICKCCRGNSKSSGKHPITGEKLHWMYYDEYLEQKEVAQ